ncbi:MAG: class I SAM-dependent methyltransferase [Oscillospiraceae bacterium]|jgi:ubiquinone/menaquinone biosynthesis C-methylase UbiE
METNTAIQTIAKYWDKQAAVFDKDHDTEIASEWMTTLEQLLGSDKNKNVLDLGTGSGFLANMTAKLGYPTVGMDISTEMMKNGVRHATACASSAMYMLGNAMELPLMDDTVDYIVNARLIWTLIHPDDMIKEWFRVLRPGGAIFCFNRMDDEAGLTTSAHSTSYYGEEVDKQLEVRDASMEELKDLLLRNGYVDVEIRKLPGLTRPEFDYQTWYVLIGKKPVTKRHIEAMGIAEFWDHAASRYEAEHALANIPVWQTILSDFIGDDKELRILDIATGTGMIANMLGSAGYSNVTGVDLSEGMMRIAIDHAREQNTNVNFIYGNAMELPVEDNSVDIVINSRLLWTLSEPQNAIKEWYRVLKPGGKVIAINELEEDGIRCNSMDTYAAETKVAEYPFGNASREEILSVFADVGFQNATINPMPGCHMVSSDRENWFAFIGKK